MARTNRGALSETIIHRQRISDKATEERSSPGSWRSIADWTVALEGGVSPLTLDNSQRGVRGYRQACPSGTDIVGIRGRLDRYGPRLFRTGSNLFSVASSGDWTIEQDTHMAQGSSRDSNV